MQNTFIPVNLQYPDGYVLDNIQQEMYITHSVFHKGGVNYYVGVENKKTGKTAFVQIVERGSKYKLGYVGVSSSKPAYQSLSSRLVKKINNHLTPVFDFTREEYTIFFHNQMVRDWEKFCAIVKKEMVAFANDKENIFSIKENSVKWNTLKEFQLDARLLKLLFAIREQFDNNIMVENSSEENIKLIRFRNPIVLGQMDYETAKKTIETVYRSNHDGQTI